MHHKWHKASEQAGEAHNTSTDTLAGWASGWETSGIPISANKSSPMLDSHDPWIHRLYVDCSYSIASSVFHTVLLSKSAAVSAQRQYNANRKGLVTGGDCTTIDT